MITMLLTAGLGVAFAMGLLIGLIVGAADRGELAAYRRLDWRRHLE